MRFINRKWRFPRPPPYQRVDMTPWRNWALLILLAFVVVTFTGRRGNDSVIENLQEQRERQQQREMYAVQQELYEASRPAAEKVQREMIDYWSNRVTPWQDERPVWKPHFEGFIQRVAEKARAMNFHPYDLPRDRVERIAANCCDAYCAPPPAGSALIPPPDLGRAEIFELMPEGCAMPADAMTGAERDE